MAVAAAEAVRNCLSTEMTETEESQRSAAPPDHVLSGSVTPFHFLCPPQMLSHAQTHTHTDTQNASALYYVA